MTRAWMYAEPEYRTIPPHIFARLERIIYQDGRRTWEIVTKGVWEIARREVRS